ncbi:LOW QUALITY PROTEIN: hypothetical protein V2J09_001752 [Rumex salicifolius]
MNCLAWNCRGADKDDFITTTKYLARHYDVDIMALIEIKISGINAQTICDKLKGRLPNSERELRPKALREGFGYYGMRRIPRFKCLISRKISSELGLAKFRSSLCMLLQRCIVDVAFGKLRDDTARSTCPVIILGIIDVLALIDLGFSGQATTWGDSTVRFVAKRLDRTLVNHEACLSWPNALVCHLPKLGSDHTPLLVTLDPSSAAWLTHANFHEFLSQSWSYDGPIVQALTRLRPKLVKWNKTVFKNIEEREKNLMGKLDVIQQQLMTDPNQDLISADSAVQHELLQVLHQEEIHWFQKSRELWLQSGDRNIAFFHSSTIIRRKRNFILMLKGETNVWIEEADLLRIILEIISAGYILSMLMS